MVKFIFVTQHRARGARRTSRAASIRQRQMIEPILAGGHEVQLNLRPSWADGGERYELTQFGCQQAL